MNGGVASKEFNGGLCDVSGQSPFTRSLCDILDHLASNGNSLGDVYDIHDIVTCLQMGADLNTKGKDGKTLLDYLSEKLRGILNWLAEDSSSLGDSDVQYIMSLLEVGTNPNVQNQVGKTLLHYVAERNDIDGIKFLLKVGANPNVQDHSGKIPSDYATEFNCLQALKGLGYISNDKTTCTKLSDSEEDSDYHSDGSCENEENPANNSSNYPNKHNDDQTLRDDPRYGSSDDNKTISTKPSDYDRKDEDSSCSSSDYLFLEDSLLAKLGIPLTTDEQELIDKFCEEIRGITAQNKQESEESILESIEKMVNEYLKKGLRLNSSCSNGNEKGDKKTVTNLILEEIDNVLSSNHLRLRDETGARERQSDGIADQDDDSKDETSDIIIKRITSNLLLKGGTGGKFLYDDTELTHKHYDCCYLDGLEKQHKNRKEELKSIACEGIVNKSKQTHEHDFKAEIDNVYFYVKYPQDSIIEPAKVLNHEKAKKLNLKVGILQIGESIVRVESIDGKRNYKDILKGSIKMSFTTEVGEISVYLSPSKKDGNKIKIEIDEENKAKFNKLKDKSSVGKNCLLEGENVSEVISKNFKMSDSVSTESIETIKDVPFTDFTQACPQQINTSAFRSSPTY